jgi:hypothetical protein
MFISRSVLLRMRNVYDKFVEKIKTHILFSVTFLNRVIYEVMWENILDPDRQQMAIWPMRIACRIPKATHTLKISITYCLYTTTMVARTRLIVTLYVHCLTCVVFER